MSVQRRPKTGKPTNGRPVKWIVRYRDPSGREHSETFTTERDAKARDAEIHRELSRGTWISPEVSRTTVRQLCEQWRDQAVRPGTTGDRKYLCDNLGPMGDYPAGQVTKTQVTAWMHQLRNGRPWRGGTALSETVVLKMCSQLRGVLARAVDDGVIGRNPAAHLKNQPAVEDRVSEQEVPTREQIRAIAMAARSGGVWTETVDGEEKQHRVPAAPWLELSIHIAMETGLRPGEVAGLRVRDVDLGRKVLHVRRQCRKRVGEFSQLKTRQSRRDVPISTALARELRDACGRRDGDAPLVAGPTGRGIASRSISVLFPSVRRVAGVEAKVTFKGLRHFYATEMLNAGVAPLTVSALLGHANLAVTSQVYAHWMPSRIDDARGALRSLAGSLRDDVPDLRAVDAGEQAQ